MDEFCSLLDRDTAKIVSFNVQKLARQLGKAVIVATTHTDLLEDLKPSVHVHKRFGKEIEVKYYPNKINETCSLARDMHVTEGSREDYAKLAQFHYREAKGLIATQKIFALKRGEETVGVIVYKYPAITTFGRSKAFGRKLSLEEINRNLALISRVIIHPKYRTIGLGVKLVKETLPLAGKPYVETVAVMAKYNPFFERAGMQKIAESVPSRHVLDTIEKLRLLGFNPILLSSEKANIKRLENMSKGEVEQVKVILKTLCRREGGYGRRLLKTRSVFPKSEETGKVIDEAGLEKIAKTLRILSFLAQTKVYLFWKNSSVGA
jgi:N-acetylglutamate synthase-like GNAT family acetyltransferase